jgi:hypothetical protein
MVEFLKESDEVTQGTEELDRVDKLLLDSQKGEKKDGSESSAAGT